MRKTLWWVGQCLLVIAASIFLVYGISLFRAAYELKDPFHLIMMIFASNLIILINAALLAGFVLRMINVYKLMKQEPDE